MEKSCRKARPKRPNCFGAASEKYVTPTMASAAGSVKKTGRGRESGVGDEKMGREEKRKMEVCFGF